MSSAKMLMAAAAWCLLVWPPAARAFVVLGGPLQALPCPPRPPGLPGGPPGCSTSTSSAALPPTTATTTPTSTSVAQTTLQSTPSTSQLSSASQTGSFSTISRPTSATFATFTTIFSSQTVSQPTESLSTATISMSTPLTTSFPMSTDQSPNYTAAGADSSSGIGSNRTLVITLSTVLSVVGVLLIAGGIFICCRYRQRRLPFFQRGISPIDDDEIETWRRPSEKDGPRPEFAESSAWGPARTVNHAKKPSGGSVKRTPPSVIVYQNRFPQPPRSSEEFSPRSFASTSIGYPRLGRPMGRPSMDKELPQTPAQARAPNARAGLTDEAIPGDPSFLPSPKRHPSRLSKLPPTSSPRSAHTRTRSSRSSTSMRSFIYGYAGSEMELQLSPRESSDFHHSSHNHSGVYSSSSIPPRLSFGDDGFIGGLSPRPLFREDIGRAIG